MLVFIKSRLALKKFGKRYTNGCYVNLRARFFCAISICFLVAVPAYSQSFMQCGPLENGYGPFDYTNPQHYSEKLPIVDDNHFTAEVESFQGHNKCGGNGCELASDIDYTLRAFPNHHRALITMARYHIQGLHKSRRPMNYTAECYFDRAFRFKEDDSTVRMVYGYFLSKSGDAQKALKQYENTYKQVV